MQRGPMDETGEMGYKAHKVLLEQMGLTTKQLQVYLVLEALPLLDLCIHMTTVFTV